jgi:recombination protein RecT
MSETQSTAVLEMTKTQSMIRIEQHIAHLLPQTEIRQRFAAVLVQQIRINPALQKCNPDSVLAAIVRMAQLHLDPAIPNECWLVPYKSEASFIVGYGGLRKLALRSPEVKDILVSAVHEHDTYESPNTPTELPLHRRPGSFRPRGRAIGYYAAALLRVGHWRVIEMSREEVKSHRDRYSKAAQSTFWAEGKPDEEGLSNFDKMALKTVLRQLCSPRHLTLTADAQTALAQEEVLYDARFRPVEERPVRRVGNGHQAANDIFGGDVGLIGVPHDDVEQFDTEDLERIRLLQAIGAEVGEDSSAYWRRQRARFRLPDDTLFTTDQLGALLDELIQANDQSPAERDED